MTNKLEEATRLQRFVNYIIDLAVAFIIFFLFCTQILPLFMDYEGLNETQFRLGYVLTLFIYYFISEVFLNRTVGKLITNTIVLSTDYTKPSFGKKILRTLYRFIPLEPLSGFAYLWHDTLTSTGVFKKKK